MDEKEKHSHRLLVIGAGLPRTGTLSLQAALQILGFGPCHHFTSLMHNDSFPYRRSRLWQRAFHSDDANERQELLRHLYEDGRYRSGVDYPTSAFLEDLVKMYPEAKFVHGVRATPQAWRKSFNDTIGKVRRPLIYYSALVLPPFAMSLLPITAGFQHRTLKLFGKGIYTTDDSNVELYHAHNEWVRKVIPAERRLEFQAKDGWKPLCEFLDVPIPTDDDGKPIPYPNLNDTASIKKGFNIFILVGLLVWALLIGASGLTWWYFMKM